jgi:hypothetical protein
MHVSVQPTTTLFFPSSKNCVTIWIASTILFTIAMALIALITKTLPDACGESAEEYANAGVTANEACCACGGGTNEKRPSSAPSISSSPSDSSKRRVIPVFLPALPIPSNHQRATPLDGLIHMAMDAIGMSLLTCRAAPSTVVPLKA